MKFKITILLIYSIYSICIFSCAPDPIIKTNPNGQITKILSCPQGIEVNCMEGIIGTWIWVNSPRVSYSNDEKIPEIQFYQSDERFDGRKGAPSGYYYKLNNNCSSFEVLNQYGTHLRTVIIQAFSQNILVLTDTSVYKSKNLVFIRKFTHSTDNRENIKFISNYYCKNLNCSECELGICHCTDEDGAGCINKIHDYHFFNYNFIKSSELALDGNLLIAFQGENSNHDFGIIKIDLKTYDQIWIKSYKLEVNLPQNTIGSNDILYQNNTGDIFFCGVSKNTYNNRDSLHVIKLDKNGSELFHSIESFSLAVNSIQHMNDGSFVLMCGFENTYLQKYNEKGVLQWKKRLNFDFKGIRLAHKQILFVNDNEIHVFADADGLSNSIHHFIFTSDGLSLKYDQLDFVTKISKLYGEKSSISPFLYHIEKIKNNYIFKLYSLNFSLVSSSRIDYNQCFIVTDLNFKIISINMLPSSVEPETEFYNKAFTLTSTNEIIFAVSDLTGNLSISKFDVNGNLKYIHEMIFPKYKRISINSIVELSLNTFLITGNGTRFGDDIVAIQFNESSLSHNQFECQ